MTDKGKTFRLHLVGGRRGPDSDYSSPEAPVLAHDRMIDKDGLDADGWRATLFLPVVVNGATGRHIFETDAEVFRVLEKVSEKWRAEGVAAQRTHVKSVVKTGENIATIISFRERLAIDGTLLGRESITWTVLRERGAWKINQVHLNAGRLDPQMLEILSDGDQ